MVSGVHNKDTGLPTVTAILRETFLRWQVLVESNLSTQPTKNGFRTAKFYVVYVEWNSVP
jgi:hypothetical protein